MSSSLRASGLRALRESRRQATRQQQQQLQRRYAHDEHHGASANNVEGFGKSFYFVVTAIPGLYLLWALSRPNTDGSPNAWSKLLEQYSDYRQTWEDRNSIRTKAIEQAAHDRNLLVNTPNPIHLELRYPEVFNSGSPINVPAGHGRANLDYLVAHYKDKANKQEEEKIRRLREEQEAASKKAAQK